ncbi:MAG: carotenoid 1,2-hydratase [Myxococcales bacterium]|nr:carotenoid 1,2-hydratase [Myxococcales bacterium]
MPDPVGFEPDPRPRRFDFVVAPGGYAWWYFDILADEGDRALTAIVFIGSVFSPHYFAARRRASERGEAPPEPTRFCAVNLALYRLGRRGSRAWVLSEYAQCSRSESQLQVGASTLAWSEDSQGPLLTLQIDEREPFLGRRPPFRHAVRGTIRLRPATIFAPRVDLDLWREHPRHRWYPVAPHGRAEVELEAPKLRFSGSAYHDVNEGDEPLEAGFASWNWSRSELDGDEAGQTLILYDVVDPDGRAHARGWRFDTHRRACFDVAEDALGPAVALPRSFWGMDRSIRCRVGAEPRLVQTLEDSPFYTRNLVRTTVGARESTTMHESIDLRRFSAGKTQFLLPFRTRRR